MQRHPTPRSERVNETLARLEEGALALAQSDRYRDWLEHLGQFHQYSVSNSLLIWLQRPHASRVAGFQRWKTLGRHVKKGEKGIKILAPIVVKKRAGDDDPDDGERRRVVTLFKVVHVFDIAQTDGDALPEIAHKLEGLAPVDAYDQLVGVARAERLAVEFEALGPDCNGYYARDARRIVLATERSQAQRVKTLAHELAHHFTDSDCSRPEKEIIAESVACVVGDALGLDTSDYSFGYVVAWSGGDAGPIKDTAAAVQSVAHRLLDALEGQQPAAGESPAPAVAPDAESNKAATGGAFAVRSRCAQCGAAAPDATGPREQRRCNACQQAEATAAAKAKADALAKTKAQPAPARCEEEDHPKSCEPWRCERCGATLHTVKDHTARLLAEHERACKVKPRKRAAGYRGPRRQRAMEETIDPAEGLIRVVLARDDVQPWGQLSPIVGVTATWGAAIDPAAVRFLSALAVWQSHGPAWMEAQARAAGFALSMDECPAHGRSVGGAGRTYTRMDYRVKAAQDGQASLPADAITWWTDPARTDQARRAAWGDIITSYQDILELEAMRGRGQTTVAENHALDALTDAHRRELYETALTIAQDKEPCRPVEIIPGRPEGFLCRREQDDLPCEFGCLCHEEARVA